MDIRRCALSLALILTLTSCCWAQALGPELAARLLQARALAAANDRDWNDAARLYESALAQAPDTVQPEPLFRLYLLSGDTDKAAIFIREQNGRLPSRQAAVMSELLSAMKAEQSHSGEPLTTPPFAEQDPVLALYRGLTLEALGRPDDSLSYLYGFLNDRQWGQELASAAILRHYKPVCRMCREATAQTYIDSVPLCRSCAEKLENTLWRDQALYAPSDGQDRLLSNAWGPEALESIREIWRANLPQWMQLEMTDSPALELPVLLDMFDESSREIWNRAQILAQQDGRSYAGVNDLGIALCEGPFNPSIFESEEEQLESLQEAKSRTADRPLQGARASEELSWTLNVAYWESANLAPVGEQKISPRFLWWSYALTQSRPGWVKGTTINLIADRLGPDQSDYFEGQSTKRPEDVFLHLVLSGHSRFDFRPLLRERRLRHRLWLIEHRPTVVSETLTDTQRDSFRAQVEAWVKTIERDPNDTIILERAAHAFSLSNREVSQELILRCQALEPDRKKWAEKLAFLTELYAHETDNATDKLSAAEADLKEASDAERGPVLTELAVLAYDAGASDRARDVAKELLTLSNTNKDWNSGNAFFKAHLVLGLLALDSANLDSAKEHLLLSAHTWGSPQLNSFGPNLRLAKELLEWGEPETVLEFLEQCRSFWKNPQIDAWETEIKEGTRPDFGPNLRY